MASTSDNEELEEVQSEKKKSVMERAREFDEMWKNKDEDQPKALRKNKFQQVKSEPVKKEEKEIHVALIDVDTETMKDRRELESLRNANAELKELVVNQAKSLQTASSSEHTQTADASIGQKLEALRSQSAEQCTSLRTVQETMQSITGYFKSQQKVKEQLVMGLAGLKDEMTALRRISEETQQRQLTEFQSTSSAAKQQQHHTGKTNQCAVYDSHLSRKHIRYLVVPNAIFVAILKAKV